MNHVVLQQLVVLVVVDSGRSVRDPHDYQRHEKIQNFINDRGEVQSHVQYNGNGGLLQTNDAEALEIRAYDPEPRIALSAPQPAEYHLSHVDSFHERSSSVSETPPAMGSFVKGKQNSEETLPHRVARHSALLHAMQDVLKIGALADLKHIGRNQKVMEVLKWSGLVLVLAVLSLIVFALRSRFKKRPPPPPQPPAPLVKPPPPPPQQARRPQSERKPQAQAQAQAQAQPQPQPQPQRQPQLQPQSQVTPAAEQQVTPVKPAGANAVAQPFGQNIPKSEEEYYTEPVRQKSDVKEVWHDDTVEVGHQKPELEYHTQTATQKAPFVKEVWDDDSAGSTTVHQTPEVEYYTESVKPQTSHETSHQTSHVREVWHDTSEQNPPMEDHTQPAWQSSSLPPPDHEERARELVGPSPPVISAISADTDAQETLAQTGITTVTAQKTGIPRRQLAGKGFGPPTNDGKQEASANVEADATVAEKEALPENWESDIDPASGSQYYLNTVTGESSWERPVDSPLEGEAVDSVDRELPEGWWKAKDPNTGSFYYFNDQTGETQWTHPSDGFGDWLEATDEASEAKYYYNKQTGETSWDPPTYASASSAINADNVSKELQRTGKKMGIPRRQYAGKGF